MSVSTSNSQSTSTAVVLCQAPVKTAEEIRFERTKQAIINRSLELHKQALLLERPESNKPTLGNLPSVILRKTLTFLKADEIPAIAAASKTFQRTVGTYCLMKFNHDHAALFRSIEDYEVFKKCGMRISDTQAIMEALYGSNFNSDPTEYFD